MTIIEYTSRDRLKEFKRKKKPLAKRRVVDISQLARDSDRSQLQVQELQRRMDALEGAFWRRERSKPGGQAHLPEDCV